MHTPRILASLLVLTSIAAADWPQWRGPARDGVSAEKGLLPEWPTAGPALAWQVSGLGKGMGSVAISGGKIFTLGRRKDGQYVIALDLATQKELWATRVSDKGEEPNGTPTVDGGQVFAVSKDGKLLCCSAANGKEQWRKDFVADFGGKMMSGWGYSESPLVDGDRVIVVPGGSDALLAALNRKTGETVWKSPAPANIGTAGGDGAGYTGVVISQAAGVKQYVTLAGRGIVSADAATGKPLWHYNRIANGTANIPTPLVWDDYVFCSSGYGTGAALLKIVKASGAAPAAPVPDAAKVTELSARLEKEKARLAELRDAREKFEEGTPAYQNADAAVQAFKPTVNSTEQALSIAKGGTGERTDTTRAPGSPIEAQEQYFLNASTFQNHHGGMVRIGDYIYAGTGHNNGFPICIEWKTGKVVWRKDRGPGKESAAMIAADGRLYFRYQDGTMALIAANPDGYREYGVFKLPHNDGPSWPHPAIDAGRLYLRSQDALMCYDIQKK